MTKIDSFTDLENTPVYLQSILDTLREPLLVLDSEFYILTCNHAFYQAFDITSQETLKHHFFEFDQGQWYQPQLFDLIQNLNLHQIPFIDFELSQNFDRIGERTLLISGQLLELENLNNKMILLGIQDITSREIIKVQLKEFNRQLEQSNRELQDFASVASHDLQEPLRKIQAFSGLLREEVVSHLTEEGLTYLERVQSAARRMQILINDLLTYSRVTTKANPFVPLDMSKIIAEVLADLEIHIRDTQAEVEVGNLIDIDADPLQMRLLVQNLISNGLKFHRPDVPPRIEISMLPLEVPTHPNAGVLPTTPMCQLMVQDNGIGFDEKYLDRIFTIFQRLHYRNEYEGTGVGLAICRKIVERHGGTITATSHPDEGATFVVTLPIHPQQLPLSEL